jgi:hypothetical protein
MCAFCHSQHQRERAMDLIASKDQNVRGCRKLSRSASSQAAAQIAFGCYGE